MPWRPQLNEEGVGLLLGKALVARSLAGVNEVGAIGGFIQQPWVREAVVDHNVGLPKEAQASDGDEAGVARAGADEVDNPAHEPASATSACAP